MLRPMSGQLERFCRERLGAWLVGRPSERIGPGTVLETSWLTGSPGGFEERAMTETIVMPAGVGVISGEAEGEVVSAAAVAVAGGARQAYKLEGRARAAQFGFRLVRELAEPLRVMLDVRRVRPRVLAESGAAWSLAAGLRERAGRDAAFEAMVTDCLLVMEALHVEHAVLRFADEDGLDVRETLVTHGLEATGGVTLRWDDSGALHAEGVAPAAFAVRGLRL